MLVNSLTSLTIPLQPWTFWIGLTASQSWFFVLDRIVQYVCSWGGAVVNEPWCACADTGQLCGASSPSTSLWDLGMGRT